MGTGSFLYRILLLVHIGMAIVGFGGLIAHALYNAKAFHSNATEAEILFKANEAITKTSGNALYALLALGIMLVAISDGAFSFGSLWVTLAFVVWVALIIVLHKLIRPTMAQLVASTSTLAVDSPETALADDPASTVLAKRLAGGEAAVHILLAAALVLMVWKP